MPSSSSNDPMSSTSDLVDFASHLPESSYAFAYGSGYLNQRGAKSTKAAQQMLDLILAGEFDFWAPFKIGRNSAETAPRVAVLSRVRRCECNSRGVLR